jgi:hypothetical protein
MAHHSRFFLIKFNRMKTSKQSPKKNSQSANQKRDNKTASKGKTEPKKRQQEENNPNRNSEMMGSGKRQDDN